MSLRRFTTAELGPVPITPAMRPKLQTVLHAENNGVHEATTYAKRKRNVNVKRKRFQWEDEDRFCLGKIAPEGINQAALITGSMAYFSRLQQIHNP